MVGQVREKSDVGGRTFGSPSWGVPGVCFVGCAMDWRQQRIAGERLLLSREATKLENRMSGGRFQATPAGQFWGTGDQG